MSFSYSHIEELLDFFQALCLTLFSFRLLSFRSPLPQVHREETTQLSQTLYKLQDRRCMVWISFARIMALDITLGIFVTLFMFYASLIIKTVMML